MKANTQMIHAGRKKKYTQGVVNPVVQRASTIVFDSVAQMKENTAKRGEQALFYGRRGTHTQFAPQTKCLIKMSLIKYLVYVLHVKKENLNASAN